MQTTLRRGPCPAAPLRSQAERDELVTTNYRLAWLAAVRFEKARPDAARQLGDADDLASIATIGLIRAAELWDPARQIAFSTYAVTCCKRQLQRAARLAGFVRVPAHIDGEERAQLWERFQVLALEDLARPDGDGWEPIAPYIDPADRLVREDTAREVRAAVAKIRPARLRRLLVRRYLDDDRPTLSQLGEEFGITKERIRQLLRVAVARLAKRLGVEDPGPLGLRSCRRERREAAAAG